MARFENGGRIKVWPDVGKTLRMPTIRRKPGQTANQLTAQFSLPASITCAERFNPI